MEEMNMCKTKFSCDNCQKEVDVCDRVAVCLPRPSDPTELCAVMWMCSLECAGVKEPHFNKRSVVGTPDYIGGFFDDDRMDDTFQKYGFVFLSI
jgi:hypothetical protein